MKTFIKKICVCGDPAVGKTSLIRRFVSGKFSAKYLTTLGTVISKKVVQFPDKEITMKLQIWDISGQAEFKKIHASAFRYAEAAFVVCDLLHPNTASNVETWISNLHEYSHSKVPVVILLNKYDLIERKQKNIVKIEEILDELNYPVLTTSAKTGFNVEEGFEILAERLIPVVDQETPIMAEDVLEMPEIFENPNAFLDYIFVRYSQSFGDTEMSLHLIRSQAEGSGKIFQQNPKEESMRIINKITEIITNFKGREEGDRIRSEFLEAYNRCNWQ